MRSATKPLLHWYRSPKIFRRLPVTVGMDYLQTIATPPGTQRERIRGTFDYKWVEPELTTSEEHGRHTSVRGDSAEQLEVPLGFRHGLPACTPTDSAILPFVFSRDGPPPFWNMQPVVMNFARNAAAAGTFGSVPCIVASPASAESHVGILHSALVGCMAGSGLRNIQVGLYCGDGMFASEGLLIMRLWLKIDKERDDGSPPSAAKGGEGTPSAAKGSNPASGKLLLMCEAGKAWEDREEGSSFTDFNSYWRAIQGGVSQVTTHYNPSHVHAVPSLDDTGDDLLWADKISQRINHVSADSVALHLTPSLVGARAAGRRAARSARAARSVR